VRLTQMAAFDRGFLYVVVWTITGGCGLIVSVQAQEQLPGQPDIVCASNCASLGYAAEYCAKVCRVPERPRVPAGEVTDWSCMTACAQRGGKYAECKPVCRLR
jgi:hypothetical protein